MNMTVKTIQDINGVESIIDFLYEIKSSIEIAIGQYEKIKCKIEGFDPATKSFKIKLVNTKKKYLLKLNGEYSFSA